MFSLKQENKDVLYVHFLCDAEKHETYLWHIMNHKLVKVLLLSSHERL